jgi:hypothetical protein
VPVRAGGLVDEWRSLSASVGVVALALAAVAVEPRLAGGRVATVV